MIIISFGLLVLVLILVLNHSSNKKLRQEKAEHEALLEAQARARRDLEEASMAAALKELEEQERRAEQEKKREICRIPDHVDGFCIEYDYPDVRINTPDASVFDLPGLYVGCAVDIIPAAPGASGAFAVSLSGSVIGYLPVNRLADMAADWHKKGQPIRALVSALSPADRRAEIRLVFYGEDRFEKLSRRNPDAKTYKLVGNTGEEMQANIGICRRGEKCDLYYDDDAEKYLVSCAFDIGYLPAAAAKIVQEYGEDAVEVYVSEIGTNENLKDYVRVVIFE